MKILDQQDTGTCQKTLKIEVPRDEIAAQLDDVYKEFIQQATVPGFRKGKAPRSIVKMKFGKHLEGEAISKAVEDSYNKALEELNLHAVTQPEMDELEKDDEDQPITYTVKFEYIPEFPLSEYTDIQPELLSTEVAEADVVKSLDDLRERNASYVPIEDRGVKDQDFVTISCNATLDGEPFNEATHSEIIIEVGSKRYLAGFEEQVLGMKLEEEKTFTLTLPNDYPQEDKRGKEATFTVKVKKIQEKRLPELDDEFAKDMGDFETLDALKERIRESLKHNYESRKIQKLRNDIREEIIKRNTFDVPPSMIRARYNFINALQDAEYRRYGQSLASMVKQDEGLLARNEKAAEEEVRFSIIMEAIAKKEEIEVTDEEYVEYIVRIAKQDGADPSNYIDRIKQGGMESYYRREALESKVLDKLQHLILGSPASEEATEEKTEDEA